jgi:DNA-binding PucR family transcriptional regulator
MGALSSQAAKRMDTDLPWFSELNAQDRSWVAMVLQAGVRGFVDWFRAGGEKGVSTALAADMFGAAPRALTGVINLQQTVDLVRLAIDAIEDIIDQYVDPEDADTVHVAVMRFGREVGFATAEVYARAAEMRGAWDARLEALVVDSVLRSETDEAVWSRASALGWTGLDRVAVVVGPMRSEGLATDIFEEVRRRARAAGMDALCATQADRLVVVLGGVVDATKSASAVVDEFGDGPVVIGPLVADLGHAHTSARAAMSALRVAPGWPDCPRPVASIELLPERALAGDGHARRQLIEEVYQPLADTKGLLDTVTAYFDHGASIEATARALFVHPNTVRYRLKAAADLTGLTPSQPRHAFTYLISLVLGRLHSL